jgi:hypothetical protein
MTTTVPTTVNASVFTLSELRRQRSEARRARAHWLNQAMRQMNRYPSNHWRNHYCVDPAVQERKEWWTKECDRLTAEIRAISPNPYLPFLRALRKPLCWLSVVFAGAVVAPVLLMVFPALVMAAGVVAITWSPWLLLALISKLTSR